MQGHYYELPHEFRRRVDQVIKPGEKVLWAGVPDWRAAWGVVTGILLFALFWCAIAFPFGVIAFGGATGLLPMKFNGSDVWPLWARFAVPLFALPFVAIGAALIGAPFVGIYRSRRTVHIVTTQRLIDAMPHKVDSHDFAAISSIQRKARKGGTGTLTIGLGWEKDSEGDLVEKCTVWVGVRAAENAERLIRGLERDHRKAS